MKFTYYTIIGKDLNLLKGHVENVRNYAGFDRLPCEKEFIIIIYRNNNIPPAVTESLINYCNENGLTHVIYDEPYNTFIDNLYACWNLGYEKASEGYVFRGGSDQVFSKDSFIRLYEIAENFRINEPHRKIILQANTIENTTRIREINAISRHFTMDLGFTFDTFDYEGYEKFIARINRDLTQEVLTIDDCLKYWGKPTQLQTTLGVINRVDGCSWLMTKEEWSKYGPIPVFRNGITGDVAIHDTLQLDGYEELLVKDCVTYHFVRGESINVQ
jgi:hypothetical protein